MLPLRTRAKQYGDKGDTFAMPTFSYLNLNSHFIRVGGFSPRRRTPQVNLMVPRSFYILIPVIRSLVQPLNCLRDTFRTRCIPFQSRVCQSCQRFGGIHISALAQNTGVPAGPPTSFSLFSPARAPAPALTVPVGQSSHLSPATPRSATTSRVGGSGSRAWGWNPRPSCSTRFFHPSDGIRRRVILSERAWWTHTVRLTLEGVLLLRFKISSMLPL